MPLAPLSTADVKKKSISGDASINVKAPRFHSYLFSLIEITVGVAEVYVGKYMKKAKRLNGLNPAFRC